MNRIRIGCSGWQYRHWRSLFYPEKLPLRRWFDHYASVFETVELNTSFYHLPRPETFDKWRSQAPPGFSYAVKASRFITHMKKLGDCEEPLDTLLVRARRLGSALGPILYQLPPKWAFDRGRLLGFLALLPRDLVHVFELREPSWMEEEVLELLAAHGVSYCAHDMRGMKAPRRAVGPIAYARFHGGTGKYRGRYPDEVLLDWADWLAGEARAGREAWAYFNNDSGGAAIQDALTLRAMIAQAMRPAG